MKTDYSMPSTKVLLCGTHASLLHTLRISGGGALRIEQVSPPFIFQKITDREEVGLMVVLDEQQATDTTAIIRNWRRENPEVPVIVVTSDYSGATTRQLFVAGAADVMPLPAEPDRVLACYENFLPGFGLLGLRKKRKSAQNTAGQLLLGAMVPGLVLAGTGLAGPAFPEVPSQHPVVQLQSTDCRGLIMTYFGAFTVLLHGQKVELARQAKYLFAYLAYYQGSSLSRDQLARVFWPEKYDYNPDAARHSLKVEINRIRKVLGESNKDLICFKQNCYALNTSQPLESDVLTFKALHQALQEYLRKEQEMPDELFQKAISIYIDNFLADFPAESYNWVEMERQRLSSVFEQMADLYSEQLCRKGEHWKAAALCNEILSRDARMEAIHRRLMVCYAQLGMMNKVEMQYRLCCQMMRQEFDAQPSPETVQVYQQCKSK